MWPPAFTPSGRHQLCLGLLKLFTGKLGLKRNPLNARHPAEGAIQSSLAGLQPSMLFAIRLKSSAGISRWP